ncbi:MAG: hypothetical protein SWH54_04640, partial [Thermodesulfobacteriota bacterium]|nr:hypothetical protein [Thermodesulfobacteriota bacterium]
MKTLSAFTEAAIDNPHVDVIRLVEITIGSITLYLCDRVFGDDGLCEFNGQLYEPMVLSWGTIKAGRIDPVTYQTEPGEAGFTIDNSKPVGGAASFTALFIDNDPQYCSVIISRIHAGATAAADRENLFVGHMEDIAEMTVDRTTVICSGFELSIINKFSHTIVDHTTYPGADPDDIGKMVPAIYGRPKRIPCIAVDAGGKTTIAQDMTETSPGNSGTLEVSDATALPSSGAFTIQIDSEQIRIASRSGNTLTLAASGARGYNSTTAVAHDKGAAMAEIQTAYVYLVADHPVNSIDAVYVDNIRQTSGFTTYTGQTGDEYTGYEGKAVIVFTVLPEYKKQVNIEADSSSLDGNDSGHSHSSAQQTIEWYFDDAVVTDPVISNPDNICDQNLTNYATFEYDSQCRLDKITDEQYSGPPQEYRIAMRVGTIQSGLTITGTFYGLTGLYGAIATSAHNGTTKYSPWTTVDGNTNTWTKLRTQTLVPMYVTSSGVNSGTIAEVWLEVKYTPQATVSGYANVSITGAVTLTGNSTAETVIGKLIAADLQGQPDDASGTYTDTANALIERPDHILKHILLSRCGLSGVIHAVSYAAASTWFAANSFRLAAPILQPPNVRKLINDIAIQARSLEFWEAGEHHLVHIPDSFLEDELSVLLLHMDGTDGSTLFTDDGVTGHTVTPYGNAQIDTAYKKFGTGSGLFDGDGDYLSILDHADFNMSSGRVDIDVWHRFQSANQTVVIYSQFVDNTHFVKLVVHYNLISFQIRNGNDVVNFSRVYTGGFTAGVQYHFALIRGWNNSIGTWAITVNGQIMGDVFLNDWGKITDPTVLPASTANGVAFKHDGSLMAVAHATSPYITIYNTSDWSKITDPTTLPAGTGQNVAFNHDGSLMAVAHSTSPYITIYNTSDWSKVTDPA